MVYCSKCGNKNKEEAKFCSKCGASLIEIKNHYYKDDDCVCEGNNRNPFVPIFWGLTVILIGLWIIFQFVIPSNFLSSLQDFSFCGLVFLIIALAIILTGIRILTK
jgi:uncharacterized membrane protein YvbJ